MNLHSTPLARIHERLGATLVPFAGWQMPVRFTSDIAEHHAVRTAVGIFDLSHMAQLEVSGPDSPVVLDRSLVVVSGALRVGKAKYSLITDDEGRVLDDLIVYRLAPEEYLVIANAANRERVAGALTERSAGSQAQVVDHTVSRAMVALQGPKAADVLAGLCDADLGSLRYYAITPASVAGVPALVARTGYTGEDGFEIIVPASSAEEVWEALAPAGPASPLPCGLAARDTLRLEAGMPLYGHELTEDVSPWEAGLGRVVNLDHEFIGRPALARMAATPPLRSLVGLVGEGRRAARAGSPVLRDGEEIGVVTSGALSPTLGVPIALALVAAAHAEAGAVLDVDVRGRLQAMSVTPLPFYRRPA